MDGISAFIKKTPEITVMVVPEPGSGVSLHTEYANNLVPNFPVFKTVRNKLPLFIRHSVYGTLLKEPKHSTTLLK